MCNYSRSGYRVNPIIGFPRQQQFTISEDVRKIMNVLQILVKSSRNFIVANAFTIMSHKHDKKLFMNMC